MEQLQLETAEVLKHRKAKQKDALRQQVQEVIVASFGRYLSDAFTKTFSTYSDRVGHHLANSIAYDIATHFLNNLNVKDAKSRSAFYEAAGFPPEHRESETPQLGEQE